MRWQIGLAILMPRLALDGGRADPLRSRARPSSPGRCGRSSRRPASAATTPTRRRGGSTSSRRALALGRRVGRGDRAGQPRREPARREGRGGRDAPQAPLSAREVAALRAWIAAGAPYDGRAGAPPAAPGPTGGRSGRSAGPAVPAVTRPRAWVRNPIDAFILAGLEAEGSAPAPEADRATLIRRVSFDLIGLPPTPEEVDAFVARRRARRLSRRLVDRLLASPRYGERWGRHWLDVVRFGESHGYETNALRPDAWPYRD